MLATIRVLIYGSLRVICTVASVKDTEYFINLHKQLIKPWLCCALKMLIWQNLFKAIFKFDILYLNSWISYSSKLIGHCDIKNIIYLMQIIGIDKIWMASTQVWKIATINFRYRRLIDWNFIKCSISVWSIYWYNIHVSYISM